MISYFDIVQKYSLNFKRENLNTPPFTLKGFPAWFKFFPTIEKNLLAWKSASQQSDSLFSVNLVGPDGSEIGAYLSPALVRVKSDVIGEKWIEAPIEEWSESTLKSAAALAEKAAENAERRAEHARAVMEAAKARIR